jgi:hypothetical protein
MLPASVVIVIVHLFAQHFDASEIAGCHPFHQFNTLLLILAGGDEVIFGKVDGCTRSGSNFDYPESFRLRVKHNPSIELFTVFERIS